MLWRRKSLPATRTDKLCWVRAKCTQSWYCCLHEAARLRAYIKVLPRSAVKEKFETLFWLTFSLFLHDIQEQMQWLLLLSI